MAKAYPEIPTPSDEETESFWSNVERGDAQDCWLWTRSAPTGYGQFWFRGKYYRSHRFSWFLENGQIPKNIQVCHNCPGGDNSLCVNPAHLFLATQLANVLDGHEKGSYRNVRPPYVRGSKHGMSKLSEEDVAEIRRSYQPRMGGVLADRYGVTVSNIARIVRGEMWEHVEGPTVPGRRRSTLTDDDVRQIRILAERMSQTRLAAAYGVSCATINMIVHRRRWAHVP